LRRFARSLVNDSGAADDLVQDCLERALGRLHLFRGKTNIRAWLFTILRNCYLNQRRGFQRRPPEVPFDERQESKLGTLPEQGQGQTIRDLGQALGRLPDQQREVVLLIGLEGMSYRETAQILDVPVGTVMSRLSRGRESLRVMMGEMTAPDPITDAELNAYVDGELDARSRAGIEVWLAGDAADAARVAAYRQQNEQLHNLFGAIIDQPIPAEMSDLVMQSPPRYRRPVWIPIAAALALLLVGAAGGWGLRDQRAAISIAGPPDYVERAIGAHLVYVPEILHPVEVTASQEDHLIAWLSNRLGRPLRPPRLVSAGFQLVGGRLLAESGLPAAQFMYEDDSGRRITVYVRAYDGKDTAFRFTSKGDVSAFYWIDEPFAYALTGGMPRAELLTISRAVFEDLTQ